MGKVAAYNKKIFGSEIRLKCFRNFFYSIDFIGTYYYRNDRGYSIKMRLDKGNLHFNTVLIGMGISREMKNLVINYQLIGNFKVDLCFTERSDIIPYVIDRSAIKIHHMTGANDKDILVDLIRSNGRISCSCNFT